MVRQIHLKESIRQFHQYLFSFYFSIIFKETGKLINLKTLPAWGNPIFKFIVSQTTINR
jgi:hypothetical protein